jgi:hypothetical protein
MDLPSSEVVKVIYTLLPGFLTAWIFYALTAHPRPAPFERVVQALIFTGIVQAAVSMIRGALLLIGQRWTVGPWTENSSFVVSIILAVLLGIGVAICANNDLIYRFLRESPWCKKIGAVTTKTSYPSEWFGAFSHDRRYVVLHLAGKRRLYGWPCEWPDNPDAGHFVIMEPEWLLDDGTAAPLHNVRKMLVLVKDVEMVEFLKFPSEVSASEDEIKAVESTLIELQKEQPTDGQA